MSKDKHDKQTMDWIDEQDPITLRTTHITPDGTKWELVLEPQDKSLLGHWSYLGVAMMKDNPDYCLHSKFDSDTIHWGRYEPEDMFNLMKFDLDREWDI